MKSARILALLLTFLGLFFTSNQAIADGEITLKLTKPGGSFYVIVASSTEGSEIQITGGATVNGEKKITADEYEIYEIKANDYISSITFSGDITDFKCSGNMFPDAEGIIREIDVTKCKDLKSLECAKNPITSLNLSKNIALEILSCGRTRIQELDLSSNVELTYVSCDNSSICRLDLSANVKLESIICNDTKIFYLDLSNNPNLNRVYCYNCMLSADALDRIYCDLPVANGPNDGLITIDCTMNEGKFNQMLQSTNGSNLTSKNWKAVSINEVRFEQELDFTLDGTFNCADKKVLIAFNPDLAKNVEITVGGTKLTESTHVDAGSEVKIESKNSNYKIKTLTINGEKQSGNTFTASDAVRIYALDVTLEAEKKEETPVESTRLQSVYIAPNPCGSMLTILNAQHIISYTFLCPAGRSMISAVHDGSATITINTASLASGLYLLRLTATDGERVIKVVKE